MDSNRLTHPISLSNKWRGERESAAILRTRTRRPSAYREQSAERYITPRALFLLPSSLSLSLSLHHQHRDKWHDNSSAVYSPFFLSLFFSLVFPSCGFVFHGLALVFFCVPHSLSAREMTSTREDSDRRCRRTGLHLRPLNVETGGNRVGSIVFSLVAGRLRVFLLWFGGG